MTLSRSARRAAALALATGTALTLAPLTAAHADGPAAIAAASRKTSVNKTANGTNAKGWIGWHDGWTSDKAEWNLTIRDTQAGRWCAQARIIIDRPGNDIEYTSKKVCGKNKTYTWKHTSGGVAFLRGVKVHLCKNLPVSNSYQSCTRVQYIKNPYYEY
ncbi:hypothetical protein [Actinomadura macrotermitis]|uniref:Ricin B lectin domain-containing protein n=1 Tax=Actinomadura macrotermitis TaxID=2585200 RepID=A0A7K0BXK5_9ACTN|nr:hypothetical protein [Actinomadura macrotermitis]MQY05920.1 hypothetical protein [Actinomadura macrotermitis]